LRRFHQLLLVLEPQADEEHQIVVVDVLVLQSLFR
jgi:hypothetical protein